MYYIIPSSDLPEPNNGENLWLIAYDDINEALEAINKMPNPQEWCLLMLIELETRVVVK